MNLRIKKIIAREFMIIVAVVVIGILAFLYTIISNQISENHISTEENKIDKVAEEQDSLIQVFNKIYPNDEICYLKLRDFNEMNSNISELNGKRVKEEIIHNYIDSFRNLKGTIFDPKYNYYDDDRPSLFQQEITAFVRSRKNKLYLLLSDLNLCPKSFREFENKYKDSLSIDSLYKILVRGEYYTKSRKEFYLQFFDPLTNNNYIIQKDSSITDLLSVRQTAIDGYKHKLYQLREDMYSRDDQDRLIYIIVFLSVIVLFAIRYLYYSIRWSILVLKAK